MAPIIYDQELIRQDPSVRYLIKQLRAKAEVVFVCYTKEVKGIIKNIRKYDIKLKERKKFVNKTYTLYFFKPDAHEAVKQHVQVDEDVVEEKLEPAYKAEDRLEIPDEILQKCLKEKRHITITMRNGHILKGVIFTYGIFSIRLQIDKKNRVILFRHAIYDLDYRKIVKADLL